MTTRDEESTSTTSVWVVYWPGEEHDMLLRAYLDEQEAHAFIDKMLKGPSICRLELKELPLYGTITPQ